MDSTLIETKSGARFAKNASDWKFWHDPTSVPKKLKELVEEGYRVVVFTNQGGVEKGHTQIDTLKKKFEAIHQALKLPMTFVGSTHGDKYRKPGTAMWDYFCEKLNGGIEVDKKKSFYCGDAAGRPKTDTRNKDHSDGDRKFAINIGLEFKTPEMLFLG